MLQLPEDITNERQYNIVTPSLIGWTHTQKDPCIAGAAWGTTPWCVLVFLVTGGRLNKTVLPGMAIPMLKIRRPNGRLIFNMEIAIRR